MISRTDDGCAPPIRGYHSPRHLVAGPCTLPAVQRAGLTRRHRIGLAHTLSHRNRSQVRSCRHTSRTLSPVLVAPDKAVLATLGPSLEGRVGGMTTSRCRVRRVSPTGRRGRPVPMRKRSRNRTHVTSNVTIPDCNAGHDVVSSSEPTVHRLTGSVGEPSVMHR